MADTTDFTGHTNRECGLHRTTGERAWCFDCSEWCYPNEPCVRCALPALRALAERLVRLDDPANPVGVADRQTVTLTALIDQAKAALGIQEGGSGEQA